MEPILYCGDPHGSFRHIIEAAEQTRALAVVLLGDMEPGRPLHEELQPILDRVWWIPGNHDADSDDLWGRVWGGKLADRNVHGRVVTLRDGTRLAGLGGVFREAVWHPSPGAARGGAPAFRSREEHAASTPRQARWAGGHHRKHWGTIYPDEVDRLADLQADVLISHEAPGYHPNGFDLLDTLARSMNVRASVHGHHHDRLDSSPRWEATSSMPPVVASRCASAIGWLMYGDASTSLRRWFRCLSAENIKAEQVTDSSRCSFTNPGHFVRPPQGWEGGAPPEVSGGGEQAANGAEKSFRMFHSLHLLHLRCTMGIWTRPDLPHCASGPYKFPGEHPYANA